MGCRLARLGLDRRGKGKGSLARDSFPSRNLREGLRSVRKVGYSRHRGGPPDVMRIHGPDNSVDSVARSFHCGRTNCVFLRPNTTPFSISIVPFFLFLQLTHRRLSGQLIRGRHLEVCVFIFLLVRV
jgi:hypothetical protein